MELRADRGRAVLVGAPEALELPPALAGALREWAEVAAAVNRNGAAGDAGDAGDLVSARGRQLAVRLAATVGTDIGYADPVRGVVERVPAPRGLGRVHLPPQSEPTPWATGLTVSGFTAAVVIAAVLTLTAGLRGVHPLLALLGNLVVAAGLAPSVWLSRTAPVWRWVGYGVAGGVVLAWLALLLGLLGTPGG